MNICKICGKSFEPPKGYECKLTCSKKCLRELESRLSKKNEGFIANQFKKGCTVHNKGVPQSEWLSPENIEKCKKTYIQNQDLSPYAKIEGRYLPYNTLKKGTVRMRQRVRKSGKYIGKVETEWYINIDWRGNRKSNYSYKRFLWECYHQQDVPKGMVVYCPSIDIADWTKENLILITRADLARINRHGYFKDYKEEN